MAGKRLSKRDFVQLEVRRLRACDYFKAGWSQADVARELEVTPAATCHWHRAWQVGGAGGLKARAGKPGRKSKVETQGWIKGLESALEKSPEPGFRTWTLDRAADVIWRQTGIRYHRGHVWRLMRQNNLELSRRNKLTVGRGEGGAHGDTGGVKLCIRRCGRPSQPESRFCRECSSAFRT